MGDVADPENSTGNALAATLERIAREMAGWVGQVRQMSTPWIPPAGADRLTRKQCDVLDNLIRVMTEQDEGDGHGQQPPIGTLSTAPDEQASEPGMPQDVGLAARTSTKRSKVQQARDGQDHDAEEQQ